MGWLPVALGPVLLSVVPFPSTMVPKKVVPQNAQCSETDAQNIRSYRFFFKVSFHLQFLRPFTGKVIFDNNCVHYIFTIL